MDITYRRNLHKSYMCIENVEDMENIIEEHEVMILQKYSVPQLLPMQMMMQDGKVQYWFEITGKQSLADYLGENSIGARQLKQILCSIGQICERLPEFLLKEDRICLAEELLYVDLREEKIYFTYLPFWQENFLQEFRGWMEETLKHIEHQERDCVELAYQVYEKSREDNISIQELLKEMRTEQVPVLEAYQQAKRAEPEQVCAFVERNQKNIFKDRVQAVLEEVKSKLKVWFEEQMKKVPKWLKTNKWLKENKEVRIGKAVKVKRQPKEKKQQEVSIEECTQLLRVQSEQLEGRLIYQGENDCIDLEITGVEYIIGRDCGQADGKIETDGISRVHAKIIKKQGDYYIEDLNSTNGTYLNGVQLKYHQSRKLNRNDWIRFGIEEYVFY